MEIFKPYIDSMGDEQQKQRVIDLLSWITSSFPQLVGKIAWNQPMFTDHETYIIGFSISKQHCAISPELAGIEHFSDDIIKAGYDHTKMLMRVRWDQAMPYALIQSMIEYNIQDKKELKSFWRK